MATEKMSIKNLAYRFGESQNLIQTLTKKYQETGDIKPLPQGVSPPSQLNSEELLILVEIMEKNNDATNEKSWELLEVATGVKVGKNTINWITEKLNYSLTKNIVYS